MDFSEFLSASPAKKVLVISEPGNSAIIRDIRSIANTNSMSITHACADAMHSLEQARFGLSVYILGESELEQRQVEAIGQLKNLFSNRVIVLKPQEQALRNQSSAASQLLAMGFETGQIFTIEEVDYESFNYNIESYNKPRSWNNARFWANPENFDKFRW
jgi:hypothetical protein